MTIGKAVLLATILSLHSTPTYAACRMQLGHGPRCCLTSTTSILVSWRAAERDGHNGSMVSIARDTALVDQSTRQAHAA